MTTAAPAGWHPDPRGRHEQRYWDGQAWTDHVADRGQASIDPVDERPRFQEVGGPRPQTAQPARHPATAGTPGGGSLWARPPAVAGPEPAPPDVEPAPPADEPAQAPEAPPEPPPGRTRAIARALSATAPGAGHLYAGGRHQTAGFALLSATILAVVIAFLGFGPFLVGLGIYLTGAAYCILDLADLPDRPISSTFLGATCVAGGTVLALALLFPWYRIRVATGDFAFNASGFQALALIDGLVLSLAAVVAGAGLGILARTDAPVRELPPVLWQLAVSAASVALALVAFRMLVDPVPAAAPRGLDLSVGRGPGILLAASAAVTVCATSVAAVRAGYRRAP